MVMNFSRIVTEYTAVITKEQLASITNEENDLLQDQQDAERLIRLPQTCTHLVYESQALPRRF